MGFLKCFWYFNPLRSKKDSQDQFRKTQLLRGSKGSSKTAADETFNLADSESNGGKKKKRPKKTSETIEPVGWKESQSDESCTMEEELNRMKVIQGYLSLEHDNSIDFDRITRMAASLFDAPFALISFVDLERQWFLSQAGVVERTATSCKLALCENVIISKHHVFVVKDAAKDKRFRKSPLVTDEPRIRFYAGAPLVSPEGYALGALCVKDTKPRPEGFSESDQLKLIELSKMTMDVLLACRNHLRLVESQNTLRHVSETLVSTIGVLSKAANLSEGYLSSDVKLRSVSNLKSVARELRFQESICNTTACSLLGKEVNRSDAEAETEDDGWASDAVLMYEDLLMGGPTFYVKQLFDSINTAIACMNGEATVTLEIEAGVPNEVSGDSLLLFRSVMNILMHGIGRSSNGSVHLRISCRNPRFLLFECEDSGTLVPLAKVTSMWKRQKFLVPIHSLVDSVGGSFGTGRFRLDATEAHPKAIFWFKTTNDMESSNQDRCDEAMRTSHELKPKSNGTRLSDEISALPSLQEKGCICLSEHRQR